MFRLDKLFKLKIYYDIYKWIKPRAFGFIILISSILIIIYLHSEYISWVEISGNKFFLGKSYIIKNALILILIISYFILNKNKKYKSPSKSNAVNEVESNEQKIHFEKKKNNFKSIKERGELKTEYQRILEGTDEKD